MSGLTETVECTPEEYEAFLNFVRLRHRLPFHDEDIFHPYGKDMATPDLAKASKQSKEARERRLAKMIQQGKDQRATPVPTPPADVRERLSKIIADPPKKIVRPPAVYSNKTKDQFIDEILSSE